MPCRTVTGRYSGVDLEVEFTAKQVRSSYGVPGSPKWWETTDTEVTEVTVCGVKVSPKKLPSEVLDGFVDNLTESVDFEPEDEPDYD